MSLATTPNHLCCPKLVPFCTSLSCFEEFLPKLFLPSALPAQRKLTKSSFRSWFRGSPLVQGRKPSEKISTSKVNSPFVVSFRFRTSSTSLTCVLCPVLLHKPTTTSHKHAHTHLWIKLMNRHHHYSQRGAKMSFLPNVRDASWANLHPQKKIPAKTSSSSSYFTGIFLEILPLLFTFILKSALFSLHSCFYLVLRSLLCTSRSLNWTQYTHTNPHDDDGPKLSSGWTRLTLQREFRVESVLRLWTRSAADSFFFFCFFPLHFILALEAPFSTFFLSHTHTVRNGHHYMGTGSGVTLGCRRGFRLVVTLK